MASAAGLTSAATRRGSSSRAKASASNGPPAGVVASSAPSASASSWAWPKSSQRALVMCTWARRSTARNSRSGTHPRHSRPSGSGMPKRARNARPRSAPMPKTCSRAPGTAACPQAAASTSRPLALGSGRVGDGKPRPRLLGARRLDRHGDDDARGAARGQRGLGRPAHRQHEPRRSQAAPLERVLDRVPAPGAVEDGRRVEADGVRPAGERGHQRRGGGRHHDRARIVRGEGCRGGPSGGDGLDEVDRGIEPLESPRGAHPDTHDLHADPRSARHLSERRVSRAEPARGAERQEQDVGPRHPRAILSARS